MRMSCHLGVIVQHVVWDALPVTNRSPLLWWCGCGWQQREGVLHQRKQEAPMMTPWHLDTTDQSQHGIQSVDQELTNQSWDTDSSVKGELCSRWFNLLHTTHPPHHWTQPRSIHQGDIGRIKIQTERHILIFFWTLPIQIQCWNLLSSVNYPCPDYSHATINLYQCNTINQDYY